MIMRRNDDEITPAQPMIPDDVNELIKPVELSKIEQPKPVLWYPIPLPFEATKAFWNGGDVQPFIDQRVAGEKGKRQQWKGRWYTTVEVKVAWIPSAVTGIAQPTLRGVAHIEPEEAE